MAGRYFAPLVAHDVARSENVALAVDALASIADHVAILDGNGSILAVNDAWNTFAVSNGVRDLTRVGPLTNYLDVCARAAAAGAPGAAAAHEGIEAVCKKRRAEFELEYRCDGLLELDWFHMKVMPLRGEQGGAVVSHCRVTALKRHEMAVRERELLKLADALPVAVKMLNAAGLGWHFNTTWLRMTSRPLADELGRNWLDDVHPDDRSACERSYQTAITSRRPQTLEYRMLRKDGTYRRLLDRVVPRYDEDGELRGFVCASLDITDSRMYEARLRDLTGRLVTAQEDERRRIARELHDDVNQRLALLAIGIEQASLLLPSEDGVRERLKDLFQRTTAVSTHVHNLSHELHSSTLEALGLASAIRTLGRELAAKGLRVVLAADDHCGDLSPDAALGLFRIVQEALSNVLKHSGLLRRRRDAATVGGR